MNKLTLIAFSFSLPFISACTPSMPTLPEMPSLPDMPDIMPDLSLPTLYKDDIHQGSVLDRFKINQLKLGMSQAQVQDLIGSPSIVDSFHNNQWNYINHSTLHEKEDIHYRLTLDFTQGKLSNIDTSGIKSLPALTDKEKALENQRLADEAAAIEALKQAKIKAQQIAQAKALEQQRLATEKLAQEKAAAEALKKKTELAKVKQQQAAQAAQADKLKQQLADQQTAKETIVQTKKVEEAKKTKEVEPSPWYKFW